VPEAVAAEPSGTRASSETGGGPPTEPPARFPGGPATPLVASVEAPPPSPERRGHPAAAGRSRFDVRPLDRITSIKTKFAFVIIIAVGVSAAVSQIGFQLGIDVWLRPPIAMVISLIIVQFLAHGMTSPLRDMERAASHIAQGDYSQRVEVTSRDEVGRLSLAFNAMASELSEVDRMRRDLVANVSHELRTPISALQAHLENIVDGVEPADPEVLRTMLAQTERLGRMVAQLLDLSRLESGGSPLHSRVFEVAPLLEQAANESRLNRPDLDVRVDVDPQGLAMHGDPERIHQVVANLLENAARYSPPGKTVDVTGRLRGTTVVIEVADCGPGIPEGEEARVFERFYRADHARATERGGAGLGLAISRWIVDLHGGHIHAERRQPAGCRMVVELPA
jgi:signal transduction histidine kinase